jgi:DNA-binding response OmpR family regulator
MDNKEKKILIVDDEEDLCEILQYNLNNEGYTTELAHSAEEALKKPLNIYDLLILDVMMGRISGFRLADKLRNEMNINVPVIFLTARDTENDLLTGFSLGADDYITKPFSVNELTARVRAVLKRSEKQATKPQSEIIAGDIEFDEVRKMIQIEKENIDLTKKEYDILMLLLLNPGRIFSRDDILQKIWGNDVIVTERTVDVNIARIRNKIGKYSSSLKNKTGYGYYFEL